MTYKELVNSFENEGIARTLTALELSRLKEIMLACYRDVSDVCRIFNIPVILGGGTCLGAVRHKGYIPWDDDFDLLMFREDYNKFQKIFEFELGDKYVLNAPNYSTNPTNRFPKILIKGTKFVEIGGRYDETDKIKIDIFIIENVPKNLLVRYMKGFKCSLFMYVANCVDIYESKGNALFKHLLASKQGRNLLKKRMLVGHIFSFFSYKKWCDIIDRVCQYRKSTGLVGIATGRKHYFGEIFHESTFLPITKGEFEGLEVELPNKTDEYLSNLFGNYMEIPPENKREKHLIEDICFDAE